MTDYGKAYGRIENYADIRELVLISLGTDKGSWWADQDFGSELRYLRQGKLDAAAPSAFRRMALEALDWLVQDGLAAAVECEAKVSGNASLDYTVTVTRPSGDTVVIQRSWNNAVQ